MTGAGKHAFRSAILRLSSDDLVALTVAEVKPMIEQHTRLAPFVREMVRHGKDPISWRLLVLALACSRISKKHARTIAGDRAASLSLARVKTARTMQDAYAALAAEYLDRRVVYERTVAITGRPTWALVTTPTGEQAVCTRNPADDPEEDWT